MALYFTGDKDINIMMRRKAWKYGWKLNEYGLWNGQSWSPNSGPFPEERFVAGRTEEEIFEKLGFVYLDPEKRQKANLVEKEEQQILF
jgi:DNA polymerase (family 10)